MGYIRGNAILKRHAGGEQVAPVDRQHAVTVSLAPEAKRALAERAFSRDDALDVRWGMDFREVEGRRRLRFEKSGKSEIGRRRSPI